MQSRSDSLMEALTNIMVGFTINMIANIIFLPMILHVPVNLGELGLIGAIFTAISLIRSYSLRRAFNGRSVWQALKDRFGVVKFDPAEFLKSELYVAEEEFHDAMKRAHSARLRVKSLIERL